MFKNKKVVIISIVLCLGLFVTFGAFAKIERGTKDDTYKELNIFADALSMIQNQYVDESKPKDLIYGAMKGMLSALDPYSEFLSPEEYEELKSDTEGRFGGLGIEITILNDLITVVSPIEGTPAWDAGIKAGDRIVKINDEIIKSYTLTDTVKLLRGEPGTKVKLTIWRQGEKNLLELDIKRAMIKVDDIKDVRMLDPGIGYIRIAEFSEKVPGDLEKALSKLGSENMKAIIIDVRNNPGGLLDAGVKVAEQFLDKDKIIVSTKGRDNFQNLEFKSRRISSYKDIPMVVLINKGSASASEILAGALQDYKRAIIIGETTFGKGSVQTVLPLSDGSAIKLTTSKYYTPLGRSIHEKGISPDIEIKFELQDLKKTEEMDDNIPEEITKELEPIKEPNDPFTERLKVDNQLSRAVDILKGLLIYNKPKG